MGKSGIFALFLLSLQGWGQEPTSKEYPVFEKSILSKAAEKRIFSADKAQRAKEIEAFVAAKPVAKVNLKSYMSSVRDQGQRGACANFATMGLVEHFRDKNAVILSNVWHIFPKKMMPEAWKIS